MNSYAVKNANTGELFAGFDADGAPIWTHAESQAQAYTDKSDAEGQALLFRTFLIPAQRKPVQVAA